MVGRNLSAAPLVGICVTCERCKLSGLYEISLVIIVVVVGGGWRFDWVH